MSCVLVKYPPYDIFAQRASLDHLANSLQFDGSTLWRLAPSTTTAHRQTGTASTSPHMTLVTDRAAPRHGAAQAGQANPCSQNAVHLSLDAFHFNSQTSLHDLHDLHDLQDLHQALCPRQMALFRQRT